MPIFRHRVAGPGSAGDTWTCTMHSFGTGTLAATHTAWTTLVTNFVNNTLGAMWKTTTATSSVTTDQLDSNGLHNALQTSSTLSIAGTGTGAGTSPRNCIVVGLRTAIPTKAGRGRMFWPGPDGGHYTTAGLLNATDVSTIATGFQTVFNAFKVTSQPIILHRGHDASLIPLLALQASTYDNVVSINIGTIPGSQRRRTNKVTNAYTARAV